jgi:hypothetical protein
LLATKDNAGDRLTEIDAGTRMTSRSGSGAQHPSA